MQLLCLVAHLAKHRTDAQVICEKADRTDIPTIDKKKYLVPSDLTVCVRYKLQSLHSGADV